MGRQGQGGKLGGASLPVSGHPEVLAPPLQEALRAIAAPLAARGFYLGGGTAIAIHLGHRRSMDLDWFSPARLGDPLILAAELRGDGVPLEVGEVGRGTLHGLVGNVRVSFLEYPYAHLEAPVEWPAFGCRLASLEDLATMKLSAIASRGSRKDFVDIYALGTRYRPLPEMVRSYQARYGVTDVGHLLYALAYFDEAEGEPMPEMLWSVEWPAMRRAIEDWVRAGLPG